MDGIDLQGLATRGRRPVVEYLEAPLRRPLLALVPFLVVVAAAIVASFTAPKKYRTGTLILVESEKVPESFVTKMTTEKAEKRLDTIRQEILSRTRLERVVKDVNPYPDDLANGALSDIIDTMRDAIAINTKGNDAFSVEYVHRDPRKAAEVANRVSSLFIEEASKQREHQVEEAYQFIDSQLQDARRELEKQEEAVRRYKESHMGTLPEQMAANLSTLQGLQVQQQSVAENLRTATDRQGNLEKSLAEQLRGGGTGTASLDPLTEINQLRTQLATLRARYTDEHPDVKVLAARIARLQRGLEGAGGAKEPPADSDPTAALIRAQIEQSKREVASLRAKQADIDERIGKLQARVELAPRTEQELATLTRDYQKMRENYLSLLNKKMDAQMAARLEERWKGEQFRILDPAHVPERPFSPNRLVYVMMGLVLGLAAGFATSLAAETLDHSVKSQQELESLLAYPVIATIPHATFAEGEARGAARE